MPRLLKLMAVLAHPDDESLGMGFTLAKYAAEGVQVSLVCATRGERGWPGPAEENPGMDALGRIRTGELLCAAEKLGLAEVKFLDIIDGEVDRADPVVTAEKIAGNIRRFQPQVVVADDPFGAYGHPDHIALTQFAQAGVLLAADAGFRDSQNLDPFRVAKFYYVGDSRPLVDAVREFMGGLGFEVDGVQRGHVGWPDWAFSAHIDGTAYWEQGMAAIACHQTQVQEIMPALCSISDKYGKEIYAIQHFYRVYSLVNGGRNPENDLFEGLR